MARRVGRGIVRVAAVAARVLADLFERRLASTRGAEVALAEAFEERLEGGDAGCDEDDVSFDAVGDVRRGYGYLM